MHLQKAVAGFDVFARSLSIGAETMVMNFDPDQPMHARYSVSHDFLDPATGNETVTIGRLVNAFFRWEFNSCETLIKDGRVHPIDYANACPDVAITSLHYYFPWAMKALVRWSIFCTVTGRKPRYDLDTRRYFDIADRDDLSYDEKLAEYRKLADAYFEVERYADFCASRLGDLDEIAVDYFAGPDFDRLLVETVQVDLPGARARPLRRALPRPARRLGRTTSADRPRPVPSVRSSVSRVVRRRASGRNFAPLAREGTTRRTVGEHVLRVDGVLVSGVLAAWTAAWFAGSVGADDVVDAVTGDDLPHQVLGYRRPRLRPARVAAGALAARERRRSARWCRRRGTCAACPGHRRSAPPRSTPGRPCAAARIGVVPELIEHGPSSAPPTHALARVRDRAAPPDYIALGDAQYELGLAIRDCASELARADVAGSALADLGDALRDARRAGEHLLAAARVPSSCGRDAGAGRADGAPSSISPSPTRAGGAIDTTGVRARTDALRPLEHAVRRARVAGYNALTQ